jgi:drug/metabolite transporter (DMT)-like permease
MVQRFYENGILIMLEASLLFAVFDTLIKYLVGSFTAGEIAFARFGFGALVMLPSLWQERLWANQKDLFYLIFRGFLGAGAFYAFVLALEVGSLSVTMVLFFTSPFWALLLGAIFLNEAITRERFFCIAAAITGITILINPSAGGFSLGHLYALLAGIFGGGNAVLTRFLRIRHNSRVIYAFQCLVGVLVSFPLLAAKPSLPELSLGILLLITAIFGLLAQITMNYGYRFIRAAEGTTILMAEAILTAAIGILLFHEPLTVPFVLGAIMIIGSAIYLGLRTGREVITVGVNK